GVRPATAPPGALRCLVARRLARCAAMRRLLCLISFSTLIACNCGRPFCGDGTVQAPEACDDGNRTDGDGCENDCSFTPGRPRCGNGQPETGEACDDGNRVDGDGCETNCTRTPGGPVCGDGRQQGTEACDDGNMVPGDGCE